MNFILRVPGTGTELTRGPPELVQHFRYRGSSHRRRNAAFPRLEGVGGGGRRSAPDAILNWQNIPGNTGLEATVRGPTFRRRNRQSVCIQFNRCLSLKVNYRSRKSSIVTNEIFFVPEAPAPCFQEIFYYSLTRFKLFPGLSLHADKPGLFATTSFDGRIRILLYASSGGSN
jgi:hypothetical protein